MLDKLQSAAPEEAAYFYSGAAQQEIGRTCIGHLRGDFGRSGEEFWVTWVTRSSPFETPAFKDELGKVLQSFGDQDVLKSRQHMLRYCSQHQEARIFGAMSADVYGFRLKTQEHRYYLRCFPSAGDYNFYLYCYARPERVAEQQQQASSAPVAPKKKTEPQR